MDKKIYVINPNSLETVTAGIDQALECLRLSPSLVIECITVVEGPPGIQTQNDVDHVVPSLCAYVDRLDAGASAFVIACFSDPGLHSVRERTRKPVIGIGEAGMLTACTLGHRIGVIAISSKSIPRHLRYYGAMGLQNRIANERAVEFSVAEVSDEIRALGRMIEVGKRLREDGADVLVMGCAGMAKMRVPLQEAVGIPVVEPCQAAVGMAIGRVLTNWHGA